MSAVLKPLKQREIDPLWQKVERALMNRIAYRDRELAELSEDYLVLEQRCSALMGVIRRQAARDRAEILERRAIAAANDCATQ